MIDSGGSWKRRLFGAEKPSPIDPAVDLRQSLTELESDLTETEKQLAAASDEANACASRAMESVRLGDDLGARSALVDKSAAADRLERLEADAVVLRAMIAECRSVLGQTPTNM